MTYAHRVLAQRKPMTWSRVDGPEWLRNEASRNAHDCGVLEREHEPDGVCSAVTRVNRDQPRRLTEEIIMGRACSCAPSTPQG